MLQPIVVQERQIGALSEGAVAGMGVAGLTVVCAASGAFWGAIIGLIVEAASKKNYGHGAGVGAAWGAGLGGATGLGLGLVASSAGSSASTSSTTAQGTNTSTSDGVTGS